ncbi:MAG: hypothetical protein MOB07_29840 [Acidobacteria bacterium]|nr:hypothetical protein [Acidobacteriota bacterium]
MSAEVNSESESQDTLKSSCSIEGAEIAPELLPRGSGLSLKTIARLLEAILQANSLEEAQQYANDANLELAEIIRRYEMRRSAQEAQCENMVKVG